MSRKIAGIFVNENGIPYAHAIVQGYKTIETRSRDMLRGLVGQTVAIVRTRSGQKATVIGYARIERSFFCPAGEDWESIREQTCIPPGSRYDAVGRGRWCYVMSNAREDASPYPLPDSTVRHGLSWCEFDLDDIEQEEA